MGTIVKESCQILSNFWEKIFTEARGKLTEKVRSYLEKNVGADVIIVTGAAGAGKSSLIESLTGHDVYIGSTLRSGTTTTALVPATIQGKRYLFVDMPGFNTVDFEDLEVFQLLMNGIIAIQPFVKFRGVLYVDSIKDNRITPAASKILKWLHVFCGPQFLKNVTIVTTMWDGLNEDGIEDKLTRFAEWEKEDLFAQFVTHGAEVYHHGLVGNNNSYQTLHVDRKKEERKRRALDMITRRYHNAPDVWLQILDEIDRGVPVPETTAARWLESRSTTTTAESNNDRFPQEEASQPQSHENKPADAGPGSSSSTSGTNFHEESAPNDGGTSFHEESAPNDGGTNFHEESAPNDGGTNPNGANTPNAARGHPARPFWSGVRFEDLRPWVRLLSIAARVYIRGSSGTTRSYTTSSQEYDSDSEYGSRFFDDFLYTSDADRPPYYSEVPEEKSSSWCALM